MACRFALRNWLSAVTVLTVFGLAGVNGVVQGSRGGGFGGGGAMAGGAQHSTTVSVAAQTRSISSNPLPPPAPVGFPVRRHVIIFRDFFCWGWPYPYPYYDYPSAYYGESYEKLGKEWGKQLKRGTVTMEQFTTFVQVDVLKASDEARSHFQVGFLKGYGRNGLAVFTQALSPTKEGTGSQPALGPPPEKAPAKVEPLTAPKYHE